MSQEQVYGGDEVNAIVLDPGAYATRAGWSAEDGPSVSVPTAYAWADGRRAYGDDETFLYKAGKEIRNPMRDAVVDDFDAAAGLWTYAMSQASPDRTPDFLRESPLLVTQQPWNAPSMQLRTLEYALGELGVPAVYLAKSPALSLFSAGRGTGLVVDVGAQAASVTPVVDGICLQRSARRSRRAGDFLTRQVEALLAATAGDEFLAAYEVARKQPHRLGDGDAFARHECAATPSFRAYQLARVCDTFKESMVQVPEHVDADAEPAYAPRTFELPDGLQLDFGKERFDIGESLFTGDASTAAAAASPASAAAPDEPESAGSSTSSAGSPSASGAPAAGGWSDAGLGDLIVQSLNACDVDVRPNLANNIVVTGGSSLVQGFTERVNQKIMQELPMLKIRVFASGNLVERKNSAWIGGSILSSLGTFHQLWVSKQEFDEVGGEQICQKRFR